MARPIAPDDPVVVASYASIVEAEVAKSHLDENDINAFISRDDTGGMDPHMQLTRGVRLLARRDQAVEARQVLEWMDAVPQKQLPGTEDPAYEAAQTRMWKQLGTALLLLGGLVLFAAIGLYDDLADGVLLLSAGVLFMLCGAAARWKSATRSSKQPVSA